MKCDELEEEYLWTNNVKTPSTIMVRSYNADDVDKAIAELKARIQLDDDEMAGFLQLEEECGGGDLHNYIAELNAKLAEKDKELRHHKYKRCLAMYNYCATKAFYELDFKENDVKWKWYSKWRHTWFKLAEKFKEAK